MDIKMKISAETHSIMKKQNKRFQSVRQKVNEIKNEIDKVDQYINENINTVENFIIPNLEALESTLDELTSSKTEVLSNIDEVEAAIDEMEQKIDQISGEQNDKLNPEIIQTLGQQVSSMEDCEKELESMSERIHNFENEIKGMHKLRLFI
jgi:phage shock protein A